MARVAFDSCFLIDFERERAGKRVTNSARAFLMKNPTLELTICPIALGEFAIGFSDRFHPTLIKVMENFELLPTSSEVSIVYARLYRDLSESKSMIGSNDLWIAAYSVATDLPLVTNNTREFIRIDGLKILGY